MHAKLSLVFIVGLGLSLGMCATDWPQFLGPTRNGVYPGTDLAENWPSEGPRLAWQKAIGHGFSGPVVADQKLILFHRVADQEVVDCFDAHTGSPVWKFAY